MTNYQMRMLVACALTIASAFTRSPHFKSITTLESRYQEIFEKLREE